MSHESRAFPLVSTCELTSSPFPAVLEVDHGMESSSSVVAEMDSTSPSDHGQPTQITSIDGFFNRKRGRPPKNRFVEVYKSVSIFRNMLGCISKVLKTLQFLLALELLLLHMEC